MLLHNKILNKCHKTALMSILTCFMYTFCLFTTLLNVHSTFISSIFVQIGRTSVLMNDILTSILKKVGSKGSGR